MGAKRKVRSTNCGGEEKHYRNPFPTVDIIIELDDRGVILISRKNYPFGWALPGGFVDYGESLEDAAVREAKEETGLDIKLIGQFHTYSRPDRDPTTTRYPPSISQRRAAPRAPPMTPKRWAYLREIRCPNLSHLTMEKYWRITSASGMMTSDSTTNLIR